MNKRDKIKKACLDLFIENGVAGTSTKMILNATGVSNGGLFHHFPSKDEIVSEIYHDIKDELVEYLKLRIDPDKSTRQFIFSYWKETISWGLQNPTKKLYIEMFSKSAIIRKCTEDNALDKYTFITDRILQAIQDEDIVSPGLVFFIYHFTGTTDSIIDYLTAYPDKYSDAFIKQQFIQYWRSIVNF